jgi:cell pole-organizing protein PopZ
MNEQMHKEPTMEEILASIRRIISEDGDAPEPARARPLNTGSSDSYGAATPTVSSGGNDDDALELSEVVENDIHMPAEDDDEVAWEVDDNEIADFLSAPTVMDGGTVPSPAASEPKHRSFGAMETFEQDSDEPVSSDEAEGDVMELSEIVEEPVSASAVDMEQSQESTDRRLAGPVEEIRPTAGTIYDNYESDGGDGDGDDSDDEPVATPLRFQDRPAHTEMFVSHSAPKTENATPPAGPVERVKYEEQRRPMPQIQEGLISGKAEESAMAAFHLLSSTLVKQSQDGKTLEELVKDMLGPMLREWVDENLSEIVERLVQEEIERIARRSGR